ncbi:MAG TPA: N-acetylmuramoyl-L-alanine amidase [Arenimonas sp.]|nr:N-acetylmuramoyl-L-alanine amidase [Arenimonas sp.]
MALSLLLAASGGWVASAQAAQLQRLSVQEAQESTRAVLELNGAVDYKVFTLANPDRLVVDLRGSALAASFKAPGPNGVVLDVRTGKPADNDLRIVFDLAAAVRPRSQIERVGAQTRLVLELLGADKAAASAPKTVQDVLGSGERKLIVAVDAGHGGKDPGALGPSGKREKDLTLATARELARQINADPGMQAVLIRDRDEFIPLQQRYMRARAAQADLFISIHADAAHNRSAAGASVYVLSLRGASSEAARWLADKENAADLVGGVELDLTRDKNLAAVLLDLSQNATMRISDDVANQVLAEMTRVGKTHKPQVERANFVVLRSPDVPSMLVETGFISNPSEEAKLSDPKHRQRLATAIVGGVRNYFAMQAPPGTWYAARQGQLPGNRLHVVSRGETLSLIAARHGVPMASIRQANGIHGDILKVGERLTIPVAAAPR